MMLLFLALMIVYIVWYQVQWDEIKKIIQTQDSWSGIQILSKSWDLIPNLTGEDDNRWITEITENKTWNTIEIATWKTAVTSTWSTTWSILPKATTGTVTKNTVIKLLSWTSIYYWSISVIEKLGIKYQYALADEKGIRYIYLGTPSYDFASIARALKGNLYTLATEQDILQNKLFGNKVVFINLPEYKDKQVLMLFYLNDGIWLVQMEYSLYHKSKTYLKSLFIDQ